MDPLIKSQLLYQLSYRSMSIKTTPFKIVAAGRGATRPTTFFHGLLRVGQGFHDESLFTAGGWLTLVVRFAERTLVILLIDNYDSFTHNLWQYLRMLGQEVQVRRHDEIGVAEVAACRPTLVVLSPGPKTPDQAGICLELVRQLHRQQPILGICLGHQVIGQAFGARVVPAAAPVHGKTCLIRHDGRGCFASLPSPMRVTRYHSLIIERDTLPAALEISAETDEGEIMGLRHREFALEGVQFHPEALLTEQGLALLRNAVNQAAGRLLSC